MNTLKIIRYYSRTIILSGTLILRITLHLRSVRAHPDEFPYVENARIILLMTLIETLRKTFSQNALY